MKKVLLITKVCFLDAALEYIKDLAELVELNVLVEIDPTSKNSNIIEIDFLPKRGTIFKPGLILKKDAVNRFEQFTKKCKSFDFFIYQNKKSIHPLSISKSIILYNLIRKLKPSYIHFDDVSIRLITLLPLLSKSKFKMILNVHDPVPHSGEKNFKNIAARMLFYKRADKFITFSKYSEKLFKETFKCYAQLCTSIKLKPYKFYSQFDKNINENKNYISFLGRFSLYKGIDIFIKVIDQLQKVCPNQNFLIAGNPTNGFNYDLKSDPKLPKNTTVIQRHLSAKEMCNLIQDSVLIICPYRDATQSGVIMTAYALNTPVIVTDVGGLPEYVIEGKTGYISICDPISIVNTTLDIISEERKGLNTKLEISEIANKYFLNSKEKLLSIYN